MRYRVIASVLVFASVFALACSDNPTSPTEPPDLHRGWVPPGVGTRIKIQVLITGLFRYPERFKARKKFAQISLAVARGHTERARDLAFDFAEFATDTYLADRLRKPRRYDSIEEALARLIELVFGFVGIEESAAEVVEPGTPATVATGDGNAGVVFEENSLAEPVLVTITRTDKFPCLPTDLPGDPFDRPQLGGCYEFNTFPPVDQFNNPVTVAGCFEHGAWDETPELERFILHKFDPENLGEGVVPLPPVPPINLPPAVNCEGTVFGATESNWLDHFAFAPFQAMGKGLSMAFGPKPLVAAPNSKKRLGGTAGSFTDVGAALPEYTIEQDGQVWSVEPLVGAETVQDFYDYNTVPASSNTGLEESDTSLLFLYEEETEGDVSNVSLVIIHDKPHDDSGGKVEFTFSDVPEEASFLVEDDSGDGIGLPTSTWRWANCCTDGGALGLLTGFYAIGIDPLFPQTGGLDPGSISAWKYLTGDLLSPMPITLDLDLPVTVAKNPDTP